MTSHSVDSPRRLLTLGRVDRVRVQVGFRASPDDRPYQQFLLDLSIPEADSARENEAFDERQALAALEPVLYAGAEAPRHFALHQHRWHTSWGVSPGALDIELLVTTGTRTTAAVYEASYDSVTRAFHVLLGMAGHPPPTPTSRDAGSCGQDAEPLRHTAWTRTRCRLARRSTTRPRMPGPSDCAPP